MSQAVSCRGLKKYYADVKAVDGLDLSVGNGECFGLLGPNGAGKTTTIEILEGLTVPDDGQVEVECYRSDGKVHDESILAEFFAKHSELRSEESAEPHHDTLARN